MLSLWRYSLRFTLRNLEAHGLADDLLERLEMSGRSPDFQFCIAAAVELNHHVLPPIVEFEARNRLGMAAVKTLSDAKD